MVRFYLYFNATIYLLFAIWCTLDPSGTAQQVGYTALAPGGRSEYLVVYGGLELGLAWFFFYSARGHERVGLLFALATYGPIVAFRWVTLARFWPVADTTLIVGGLETALLVAGLLLWRQAQQISSH